jgi:acetoin utilization deacetylase AcuC-like enzyme
MLRTLLYTDTRLARLHVPPRREYESPWRLKHLLEVLRSVNVEFETAEEGVQPSLHLYSLVHRASYLERLCAVARACRRRSCYVDPDHGTYVDASTPKALSLAASLVYAAARRLIESRSYDAIIVLVRPPGHHAGLRRFGGYCLANNAALAVELLRGWGIGRVAVVDLDAHYGDGIAEIFYGSDQVLYVSIHQDPRTLYPYRGFPEEVGRGRGLGFNVAVPLPKGSTDAIYIGVVEELVIPLIEEFNPEAIVVPLGFDVHWSDPLADLRLTCRGVVMALESIASTAQRLTGKPALVVLEGGYSKTSLSCIAAIVAASRQVDEKPWPTPLDLLGRLKAFLRRVVRSQESYWQCLSSGTVERVVERVKSLVEDTPPSRA